jgi:tetratricopeptide (TPR) repeat protein
MSYNFSLKSKALMMQVNIFIQIRVHICNVIHNNMFSRLIVFFACLLAFSLPAVSQNNADIKKGDAYMRKADYAQAAAYYTKAVNSNKRGIAENEKLGRALTALGDYQNAEPVYRLLASLLPDSAMERFDYAQVLRRNLKYGEADKAYQAYFKAHADDPLADEFRNFETKVKPLFADTDRYKLIDITQNNAGANEGPSFCVYFVCYRSKGHPSDSVKKAYELYLLQGGNPSNPAAPEKSKGDISGSLNEGPATFGHNGREMIFTRSNGHKSADGQIKLGLYHADYDSTEKKWVNIAPLNFIDYDYNFMQPSLSKDGSMLFFASDMKGGWGETDIYVCYKQGKTWSAPVNPGRGINTRGKEETPFIADDGVLYFTSDSRMGLGGLDIYSATLSGGAWGHAKNLGAPINSAYDDFGYILVPAGHSGYLVSNRPDSMGGNDIYQFIFLKQKP